MIASILWHPIWLFFIKTDVIVDEGIENFIAIIVPRDHVYLEQIISRYNAEIEMFKTSK